MRNKPFILIAGVTMILAVVIGAFGAHGLSPYFSDNGKAIFQTGNRYHFYHGLAMWITILLGGYYNTKRLQLAFWHFLGGITLFSGSLYLLSVKSYLPELLVKVLGPITPLGGLLLIAAWLILTKRLLSVLNDEKE